MPRAVAKTHRVLLAKEFFQDLAAEVERSRCSLGLLVVTAVVWFRVVERVLPHLLDVPRRVGDQLLRLRLDGGGHLEGRVVRRRGVNKSARGGRVGFSLNALLCLPKQSPTIT